MAETDRQPDDVIQSALAIRAARAIDDHLQRVTEIKRMQVDQQLAEILEFRDQFVATKDDEKAVQQRLLNQVIETLTRLVALAERPPAAPPPTQVTLEQQPVTVNVPKMDTKPHINFAPAVTVPESQVVIERQPPPSRAIIKHSDGTQSQVEFKN